VAWLRTPVLAVVGLGVAALFALNVVTLAGETNPLVWVAAAAAAFAGAGAFVLLLWHPPEFVEKMTGARRGLFPIAAAGIAVLVVGSSSQELQLVVLSFFAGLLAAAIAYSLTRRRR
jgi:hypothetical protein